MSDISGNEWDIEKWVFWVFLSKMVYVFSKAASRSLYCFFAMK